MAADSVEITQRLVLIGISSLFAISISRIAYINGFFQMPPEESHTRSTDGWKQTFTAFVIFMLVNMILPAILMELLGMQHHVPAAAGVDGDGLVEVSTSYTDTLIRNWANIAIIVTSFVALTSYFFTLNKTDRDEIWGRSQNPHSPTTPIKDFFTGAFSWFIIYPWILIAGQLVSIATTLLTDLPPNEQVAVKLIKDLHDKPLILGITVLSVFTIVPFVEELLFRGFMQSWLKNLFGMTKAILITSVTFALFHFGVEQGISNFELLISLFILSCFLGFLKEKRRSLWASIGLHSAFNLISLTMLLALQ